MRFKVNPLDPTGLSPIEDSVVIAATGGGGGGPSTSIGVTGQPQLTGEVTLSAGSNVTLSQSGQDIAITSTATGLPTGGTTGQLLAKNSNTNYDVTWIDNYSNVMKQNVKLAEAVTKGQAVYVSGSSGTNILVKKADNSSDATSATTIGLAETTGILNDFINVVTEGIVSNIDTSGASAAGDAVWLGTSGNLIYGLSNEPVAPAHVVYIGTVVRKSATVGEIYVNLHNGWELNELHNVLISGLVDAQILTYEAATQLWKNKSVSTALGYTPENVANKSTNTALGTSDTLYPTQNAVKTYADNLIGNANALVYKGVIDCSTNPNYPAADAGWLYVVSVAGKIGGASGIDVEVGDLLICNTDGTVSGNQATVGSYWNIIQKNIIGAVTGPASSVDNNVAVFDGTTGKVIKDGGAALSSKVNIVGDTMTGELVVSQSASGQQNSVALTSSSATASAEPTLRFRNSAGNLTTAAVSSKPGSTYTNSEFRVQVADSSKVLQDRLKIDVAGQVTLPTAQGSASSVVVTTSDSQTLTNKTLTSPVLNTGVSGTAVDTDGTLAANSDTKLSSQKAVKTYVDARSTTTQTRNEVPSGTINGTNTTFTLAATPAANSERIHKNGIRLKPGAGNDYTISGATITMATAPATGTVLLADYEVAAGTFAQGVSTFITNEVPSGSVNGSNTSFTTVKSYVGGTLEVYINGVKQQRTTHYTETTPASGTFTMSDAPLTGDLIEVRYQNLLSSTGDAATVNGFQASSTPSANKIPVLDANAQFPASSISNPYKFSVYKATDQTGLADVTYTTVQFDTKAFDTNTNFNTSTYKYTCPVTGYYQFNVLLRASGTGVTSAGVQLVKGTSTVIAKQISDQTSAGSKALNLNTLLYMTANDAVFVQVYIDVSSSTGTVVGGSTDCQFSGFFVSV